MARFTAWGQLLRLSMGPSAAADALAGLMLGAGLWPAGPAPWCMILGSLAVYHGGMALNDWSDRSVDAKTRPARPIPSGRIQAGAALACALLLLSAGPLLVAWHDSRAGLALGLVALAALLYDTAGRGPWLGPLLLGLCRAGNMGAALLMAAGGRQLEALDLAIPLGYGAYVFVVSRLGRLEDGEDRIGDRMAGPRILICCAAILLLAPAIAPLASVHGPTPWARAGALLIGLLGAAGLMRAAFAHKQWQPKDVIPVMGMALRRLLLFSAAVALLAGSGELALGLPSGLWLALIILAGYPLSHRLRRLFPPS